jgi:hypothetical protein
VSAGATRLAKGVVDPGSTLMDGHPGIKRLPCLMCLVYFQCSLMTL